MKAIPKRSRKSPTWIESNVAHITSGDVEGEPIKGDSSLCGERLRVPKPGSSNEPNRWLMRRLKEEALPAAGRDETDSHFVPGSIFKVVREFALDRFVIAALFCWSRGVGEHNGPRNTPPG